ncbi:MAG: L-seryl-tRNA(Sec) selenium transferase [Planctomycetes bacterium]|nr:L-seryl-tRNA(Sec) selenium transferase [Planctomycetota bacterium]
MKAQTKKLLRSLPAVSTMLEHEEVIEWLHGLPRATVVASLQAAIDSIRAAISSGEVEEEVDEQEIIARAEAELFQRSLPSLRRVINATGIVLHTGLGRAPLSEAAVEALVDGVSGYCNLEYELDTGKRGQRATHVAEHLVAATGAEAATVVNNNAAATLLILQTFAAGREVVVSRGQLVEIGGSFRLPEIMRAGGAILREVGTTNRTRASDYERAINDATALLLRVHTSNYRIVGFTESTPIETIAAIAHRHELIAVDDLGSGALFDLSAHGLPDEPCVRKSLEAGADLVCFSGDKLLGGPQCGVIVGRRELVQRIESNPLMRTYRVGKMTLLALEATLRCYVDAEEAMRSIPHLAMLAAGTDELAERARTLCALLETALPDEPFLVCSDVGFVGGGSMPGKEMETVVIQWRPSQTSVDEMAAALRQAEIPVVTRIRDDAICFDLRTLQESDFEPLVASTSSAYWDCQGEEDEEDEEDQE